MNTLATWGALGVLLLASCQTPAATAAERAGEGDWSDLRLDEAPTPDALTTLPAAAGWERRNTTFYHVWVSAFADGPDADQTGDLVGLRQKVEAGYFTDLGVNALWLSPIFRAASLAPASGNKHGYDTIDYDAVDPIYGTREDLWNLLVSCHSRGIRVIFDFVPNHTSTQHAWFTQRPDWYVVRSEKPAGWTGFDGASDWYPYPGGGWYYGVFWSGMPDLNYRNPEVRTEMASVVSRWLGFGFDGLRIDAVKYLAEGRSSSDWKDQPETYLWYQALRRQVLDPLAAQGAAKMMVAENWESNPANLRSYLQKDGVPAFTMTFDFDWPGLLNSHLSGAGSAGDVAVLTAALVDRTALPPAGTAFGTFQSSHDNVASRPATALAGTGSLARQKLAAALSILGGGTPFVYYGNEIGMTGAAGNDSNLRQPFSWATQAAQAADPQSLWRWHQTLLTRRATDPAWNEPRLRALGAPPGVLAYLVTGRTGDRTIVAANLSSGTSAAGNLDVDGTAVALEALPGFGVSLRKP